MATETDVPDLIPLTKRELEVKELKSELSDVTANEVPQEVKIVESLLIQPPETIKILDKAEDTAATNFLQVADVNVGNKGDVEAIDGEIFLESPSITDGKSKMNTEENQLNTKEEFCGMHNEEGGRITDKHLIAKAYSVENAGVIIQTPDLAKGSSMEVGKLGEVCNIEEKMGYISSTETTSIEQDFRETSFEEEKKSTISSSSVGTEMDPETIQPSEDIEDNNDKEEEISFSSEATNMDSETKQPSEDIDDNKDKGEEMLCAGVKDVCMPNETAGPDNHKTEDATESSEADKDKLDESISAFEEGSIETIESSEKMKYVISMEDETQNKDSEPSLAEEIEDECFQKEENLETFKEESDAELKDIMKERHNGEQNHDDNPKAIDTADSSPSSTCKVDEISEPEAEVSSREPEESLRRKSMDLAQTETLMMECKNEGVMAVPGKDDTVAANQDQIETPQHEEYSEQGSIQTTEPLKVNFESTLDVASEEIGKKIPVGSPEEFLGETRNIYTKFSDDVNTKEMPKQENLSTVDLDDKNGSAEVEIPNKNGNDLCVTHPPVEVTVQVGREKHDGVPIPESGDQVHEAFEAHKEEKMHINETYKAGKSLESTILEHTFNVRTSGPDNQKTNEATESGEAAEDNLDEISPTKVAPGASENLENSSMAFEEGNQETIESSENMKDVTSEDEVQNKNTESSLVQKVEDICFQKVEILETFNEEPATELKDIIKGSQNGEHNQNEILKTIVTADSSQIIIGKVDDNSEPKADVLSRDLEESTVRESKDLAQIEALTMECKHEGLTAVADEDDTQDQIETTKHEEHLEQSSMQKTEPTKENSESTLNEDSEDVREQIPVGSPKELLGETRKVETEISDDINKETPEEKNLSILDLDEKIRSAEVEIPRKNENNLCVTHPKPVEKNVQEGGVKHSEVSISELEDQGHEAPKEEEEHVNETYEASKSPESTIVEHTSTGVSLNIDALEKGGELNTEEESREINIVENIKEEIEQKEKAADEEFHRATTCDDNRKHTFEEEIPVTNSTPLCTGEEPDHYNQEDKIRSNSSDEAIPESDGRDQRCKTSNESLNVKEPITEEQAIQEYENTKITDKRNEVEKEMKIEEDITTKHSLESASDDTEKCFEDNDTEVKCKAEMGKELETTSKCEDIEKQVLEEESKVQERSIVLTGELEDEDSKEDAMCTKMPKQEVIEVLQTACRSTNVGMQPKDEDGTTKDNFAAGAGEETKNECCYEEEKEEKGPDTEVLETNYRGQDTAEHTIKNCVSIQSAESFEEKTVQDSSHEDEANEHYDNAETSTIISESAITDFPSSSVGDKIVEETLKEDRRDTLRSEVSNANTECIVQTFDAMHSIEEREARALKSDAELNESWKDKYITGSIEQEITPKESNLHMENSSMPETSKQEIREEILEKADTKVTVVAAETSLTEAVSEYTMQADSSDMVTEEKGLVTEGGISNIPKPVECSDLGENKGMEIPTARTHITDEAAGIDTVGKNKAHDTEDLSEIARAETSLDASEQIINESSALSMEEHEVVIVEVSDITSEAPEKDSGSCGHEDIPSLAEIKKDNIMEMEDETTNPRKMGSTDIEKESANDDAQDEDQEMHTPSELTNEKHINQSDVELSNRVSISEADNCSEIAKLEMIEDGNSSDIGLQKDKSENETAVNEASKRAEACDRSIDTEKPTVEQEDSAISLEGSSKEGVNIKKATVEFEAEGHSYGSEASEATSISGLTETNIKSLHTGEELGSAPESVAEDESNIAFPETIRTNSEEESYDDENQTADSIKDQISGQDIQEGKQTTNEEMEPRLKTQKEAKETQDATLTEKLPREIQRADESEIHKEQTMEGESFTKELHMMDAVDETVNEVTDLDVTPIQSLEATDSDNLTEMVKSKVAEDFNQEFESSPMTKTLEEEIQRAVEKPVDDSSSVSEEKINKENTADTEHCDTSQQESEVDNMKLEEISNMVSQLPIHEHENADHERITVEKSDAHAAEVEETKIPEAVSESKDQGVEEIHETGTSLTIGDSDTNEIEKQITEVPGALPIPIDQGAEAATDDEILEPTVVTEVTRSREFQLNDEPVEVLDTSSEAQSLETGKTADSRQQDAEVDNMKLEESSTMTSHLPTHEYQTADMLSMNIEKSDVIDDEETKIPDATSESKTQGATEIRETETSLTTRETDSIEMDKKTTDATKALSEPINQGDEAASNDETRGIVQAEKREGPLQMSFSDLLPNEEDGETTTPTGKTEDACTKEDDTDVDNLKLEETSGMDSHLLIAECESAKVTVEKTDADEVKLEENKILDAVSKPRDQDFEEIHETWASPTAEITDTDKIEEEIKVIENVSYQDVDAVADGQTPDQPLPVGKSEEELPVLSSPLFSSEHDFESRTTIEKKEDKNLNQVEIEVDMIELEATGTLPKFPTTELREGQNRSKETTEADEAIKKDTSPEEPEEVTGENQVVRNSLPVSPHEETVVNSNQEDELLAEYCPGERTNEELFEESEKAGADKNITKTITAEDRCVEDPYQVLVGDETANISPSEEVNDGKKDEKAPVKNESWGDEINLRDAAIEATTPIEEVKSFEVLLAKHEDRTSDSSEETVMSKDEKQKNPDLAVPPIKDAMAEEAPDYKFSENFDEASTLAPTGPTHETIETYGENKEIASADNKNSETLMDNEKQKHQFLEISCERNCSTDGWNLKEKELYVDKPSISCSMATSQEEIADKENENTADETQDFTSGKQTTEAARMLEVEKSIQFSEELTKVEELEELSTIGNESKLDEANIHSTTDDNEDEKTQNLNEIPNLLYDAKDTEASHEGDTMNFADVNEITKDTKDLEKTSLSISHEQIARDADPSDSTETINATATTGVPLVQKCPTEKAFQNAENKPGYAAGSEPQAKAVDYGEEEKLGEECQETTEKSIPIDSTKMSLSELQQRSTKRTWQGVEHLTKEKEVAKKLQTEMAEKLQTEIAETARVEEAKTDEEEEEEGDEHKKEDSGSDAPVVVEASRDVKVPHKKSHHILSGVGSKVKHSIAKVKKVITGKSSHPKTTTRN